MPWYEILCRLCGVNDIFVRGIVLQIWDSPTIGTFPSSFDDETRALHLLHHSQCQSLELL